jgi:short chain dehydrogenase
MKERTTSVSKSNPSMIATNHKGASMTVTTPITTPFKWETTAAEVVAGIDLAGSRVIVTGGASGIGLETARALATTGAQVTLAVRNADAGQCVASEIEATTGRSCPICLAARRPWRVDRSSGEGMACRSVLLLLRSVCLPAITGSCHAGIGRRCR